MSVVKINVLNVPAERAAVLEERFAKRAGEVDKQPGFEGFELLRPSEPGQPYYVYTRWASEEAFEAWTSSQDFGKGHAQAQGEGAKRPDGPAATGSNLLSYEVVLSAGPSAG